MFKSITIIILLLFIYLSIYAEKNHSIEIQAGSVIDENIFNFKQTLADGNYNFSSVSLGYVYKINNFFSLGAWGGLIYNTPFPACGGVKLIFFDKERFAISVNPGIVPSIGVYYHNILLNLMVGYIYGDLRIDPITHEVKETIVVRPYVEIGYSFAIM